MSQRDVERVVGRLVTDEAARRRFAEDPEAALLEMVASGLELTCVEMRALARLDAGLVAGLAEAIDPCIHKVASWRGPS